MSDIPAVPAEEMSNIELDIVKWIKKYSSKNYYRIPTWMDLDDLIQEGYEVVAKCRRRYGNKLEHKHFKSLVMVSFSNRITDLSNYKTRVLEDTVEELPVNAGVPAEGFFAASLALAPKTVKAVLNLFTDGKVLEAMRKQATLTNEFVCEMLDTDPTQMDLLEEVKEYFSA